MGRDKASTVAIPTSRMSFRMLSVRIEPELLKEIEERAKRMKVSVSDVVRSCLLTGLFLKDVDSSVRSRIGESLM